MNGTHPRVALFGGLPSGLGGGGLEIALRNTAAALADIGVQVVDVHEASARFDVLHCFSAEPHVWHLLRNWSRNRTRLIVTPTIVLTAHAERAQPLLARVKPGLSTTATMRRDILRQADRVVCLTEHERCLVGRLGVCRARTIVIGNGSGAPRHLGRTGERTGPIVMIGTIDERKSQVEVLEHLAGRRQCVVMGAFAGSPAYKARFDRVLARGGVTWLGPVTKQSEVWAHQAKASVMLHLSKAEGESLAVLDSLALGVPVVVRDIPVHRALESRFPGYIRTISSMSALQGVLTSIAAADLPPPPVVPTWTDVAQALTAVYAEA